MLSLVSLDVGYWMLYVVYVVCWMDGVNAIWEPCRSTVVAIWRGRVVSDLL